MGSGMRAHWLLESYPSMKSRTVEACIHKQHTSWLLQEAVDSAEQWKAFAEKLGKDKGQLEARLAELEQQLQVSQFCFYIYKGVFAFLRGSH